MQTQTTNMTNLYDAALSALLESDVAAKIRLTNQLQRLWQDGELDNPSNGHAQTLPTPGRPALPKLVAPRDLPKRRANTGEGKAALVHAICHIEFNAINLALDAVYRFRGLPDAYYTDWLKVAAEEAYHFSLLAEHLSISGYGYGDFDAHNGLWEMALETDYDVLVRMALVPRVMEARGLDVTPAIMAKLEKAGDNSVVEILRIIQRDEVGHVEIGTKWYRYFCKQRGLSPDKTFFELVDRHMQGQLRGPFDMARRKQAGFSDEELTYLREIG